jgi:hypothetical protein
LIFSVPVFIFLFTHIYHLSSFHHFRVWDCSQKNNFETFLVPRKSWKIGLWVLTSGACLSFSLLIVKVSHLRICITSNFHFLTKF